MIDDKQQTIGRLDAHTVGLLLVCPHTDLYHVSPESGAGGYNPRGSIVPQQGVLMAFGRHYICTGGGTPSGAWTPTLSAFSWFSFRDL